MLVHKGIHEIMRFIRLSAQRAAAHITAEGHRQNVSKQTSVGD